jgi:hypothetical protein
MRTLTHIAKKHPGNGSRRAGALARLRALHVVAVSS